MRVRLVLAGAVLAAVTVVPVATAAEAVDGPAGAPKTAANTYVDTPGSGFAAVPQGNRELVGRIMTGLA
ncbi:hypothetical protein ACH4OW_32080 [Streptomyces sp. NPDC017056]|uniref:hypothetical protein n=1 Tax=Streptomyces sp. NPDC017056 TaxID=3364973 RepID=UPI00379A9ED6